MLADSINNFHGDAQSINIFHGYALDNIRRAEKDDSFVREFRRQFSS
jgi:hypothetical protein